MQPLLVNNLDDLEYNQELLKLLVHETIRTGIFPRSTMFNDTQVVLYECMTYGGNVTSKDKDYYAYRMWDNLKNEDKFIYVRTPLGFFARLEKLVWDVRNMKKELKRMNIKEEKNWLG